ncbi:MAG: XrtA/PEP-CTERM system TPR-repeat protein PrsT [Pseudomonadota bacterium]
MSQLPNGRGDRRWCVALLLVLLAACSRTGPEHLAEARAYIAANEQDAAIIELRNALQQAPDLLEARLELGRLLFASGSLVDAQAQLDKAQAGGMRSEEIDELLGNILIRQQRASEVITDYDARDDLSARLRAVLGLARLGLGDATLGEQELRSALAANADLGYAHFGLGDLSWRRADLAAARDHLEKAAALLPQDPEPLLRLAEFEIGQRDLVAARRLFTQVLKLPGYNIRGVLGEARVELLEGNTERARELADVVLSVTSYGPALYLKALISYEDGELQAAEIGLREVLAAAPDYLPGRYLMGAVKFRQRDYVQAEANLATYLNGAPGDASARKLLAAVRMQLGDYLGVADALGDKAVGSSDAQTLAILGTAYARAGRLAEATEILDRAVQAAPDAGNLRNQLALTLLAAGESSAAIGQLKSAIDLESGLVLSDYLLVLAELQAGNTEAALASAIAYREAAPEDPMADNLIGTVLLTQGDVSGAEAALDAALGKDAAFVPAALNLVQIALNDNRPDDARATLEGVLAADPGNERALIRLAELAMSDRDTDGARAWLERAVAADGDALRPRLALSQLGVLTRDHELADLHSQQALRIAPGDVQAGFNRVETLLAAGRTEDARTPLTEVARVILQRGDAEPAAVLALARLRERAGQSREARPLYEQLAAGDGREAGAASLALLRLAIADGNLALAKRQRDAVPELARKTTLYALLEADVRRADGDTAGAESGYRALYADGNRDAMFRLVALYSQQRRSDDTTALLDEWLGQNPDDIGALIALGNARIGEADAGASRGIFEDVLQRAPDNVVALNNLAWLYQQSGDARAEATARRAYELAPQNADVVDTLGWIVWEGGQQEAGAQLLEEALALAPQSPTILYHAARARAAAGAKEQAIRALQSTRGARFADRAAADDLLAELLAR